MAHFAIVSPPYSGHLYPLGSLGCELARRGHRLTVVAYPTAAPLTSQLGLPLYGLETDHVADSPSVLLRMVFSLFHAGGLIDIRDGFRWQVGAVLEVLPGILKELAVDGVVVDQTVAAGGTVAEQLGLPFVTVCGATPWNVDSTLPPSFTGWPYARGLLATLRNRLGYAGWRWLCWPALKHMNRWRESQGLRSFASLDETYSPLAQISQLFPGLEFPRLEQPAHFYAVGSLSAGRVAGEPEFPWHRLDGRPLIYASLGTIADPTNRPVYARIAAACAGLDAQLVLGAGDGTETRVNGTNWTHYPAIRWSWTLLPSLRFSSEQQCSSITAGSTRSSRPSAAGFRWWPCRAASTSRGLRHAWNTRVPGWYRRFTMVIRKSCDKSLAAC